MFRTIVKIDGMRCGMCESHMNDAFRRAFAVRKVSSSHARKETVILSEDQLPEEKVRQTVERTGYDFLGMETAPYEKKGLLASLFGK